MCAFFFCGFGGAEGLIFLHRGLDEDFKDGNAVAGCPYGLSVSVSLYCRRCAFWCESLCGRGISPRVMYRISKVCCLHHFGVQDACVIRAEPSRGDTRTSGERVVVYVLRVMVRHLFGVASAVKRGVSRLFKADVFCRYLFKIVEDCFVAAFWSELVGNRGYQRGRLDAFHFVAATVLLPSDRERHCTALVLWLEYVTSVMFIENGREKGTACCRA